VFVFFSRPSDHPFSIPFLSWLLTQGFLSQDSEHDVSAGVRTLAVTLKPHIRFCFSLLATMQLLCLSILDYRTQRSTLFWVLGVGVWAGKNFWHIRGLRIVDRNWAAGSGHAIFMRT
jgi:4-hydroxybenzoate polyprenyltransferase